MKEAATFSHPKSIFLHLLPGVAMALFYFLPGPLFGRIGVSPILVIIASIPVVLVPLELGILFYYTRKNNDTFSLKSIIPLTILVRKPVFVGLVLVLLVWNMLAFILLAPVDHFVLRECFAWLPDWSVPSNSHTIDYSAFPKFGAAGIIGIAMLLNVVVAPIVEETYYRGFLLPRIRALAPVAAFLNSFLFSLAHPASLWMIVSRFFAVFPISYISIKKRNIF